MINGFYTIVEKPNVVQVVENFYKGLFAVRNGLNCNCNLFFNHSENKAGIHCLMMMMRRSKGNVRTSVRLDVRG